MAKHALVVRVQHTIRVWALHHKEAVGCSSLQECWQFPSTWEAALCWKRQQAALSHETYAEIQLCRHWLQLVLQLQRRCKLCWK